MWRVYTDRSYNLLSSIHPFYTALSPTEVAGGFGAYSCCSIPSHNIKLPCLYCKISHHQTPGSTHPLRPPVGEAEGWNIYWFHFLGWLSTKKQRFKCTCAFLRGHFLGSREDNIGCLLWRTNKSIRTWGRTQLTSPLYSHPPFVRLLLREHEKCICASKKAACVSVLVSTDAVETTGSSIITIYPVFLPAYFR